MPVRYQYLCAVAVLVLLYLFESPIDVVVLLALLASGYFAYRDRWLRHALNQIYAWCGQHRYVIDPEIGDMLGQLKKHSRMRVTSSPHILNAVKSRTGYTERQLWLLSMDGILAQTNGNECHALDLGIQDPDSKECHRQSLVDWWGINDRSDLLDMLAQMRHDNHSMAYREKLAIWEGDPAQLNRHMKELSKLRKDLQLIGSTRVYVRDRALLAWDYGRCVMLSKVGYAVGYLSEAEAWAFVEEFGTAVGERYDSWLDYGINYLIGRTIWGTDKIRLFNCAQTSLLELLQHGGDWAIVPWLGRNSEACSEASNKAA